MTKIGRSGFMLAEVVVVAMVVATVLITLFTGVNNVSSAYETRNRYYDVDSLYVAIEVNEKLKRDNALAAIITSNVAKELNTEITDLKNLYSTSVGDEIYVYITPYTSSKMSSLSSINTNLTFSDYLDYLNNNIDFSDEGYNYMIMVERRENKQIDDCYYYALKLKY